jgi:hypothetical protein
MGASKVRPVCLQNSVAVEPISGAHRTKLASLQSELNRFPAIIVLSYLKLVTMRTEANLPFLGGYQCDEWLASNLTVALFLKRPHLQFYPYPTRRQR